MTDQEIIDIAKKHMEYSVMSGFVGVQTTREIVKFARALIKTVERKPCAGLKPPCKFDCPCFFEDAAPQGEGA